MLNLFAKKSTNTIHQVTAIQSQGISVSGQSSSIHIVGRNFLGRDIFIGNIKLPWYLTFWYWLVNLWRFILAN